MFTDLDRFWNTIVFRDFKYLLIGGGPLVTVLYLQGTPAKGWESWLLMMFGSYVIGIALFHFALTFPSRKRPLVRLYPPGPNSLEDN